MNVIGIIGGMGPMAGVRLAQLIVSHTRAERDADHPSLILISQPALIADRTEFLLGRESVNPAIGIVDCLEKATLAGATVAGIPCNTAHAEPIFAQMLKLRDSKQLSIEVLHMIELTARRIAGHYAPGSRIGLLGTLGTIRGNLYDGFLEKRGLRAVKLTTDDDLNAIHQAVYHPTLGIKSRTTAVTTWATDATVKGIEKLIEKGVDGIVLACTELPLAFTESSFRGCPLFDPSIILAQALVEKVAPGQWI